MDAAGAAQQSDPVQRPATEDPALEFDHAFCRFSAAIDHRGAEREPLARKRGKVQIDLARIRSPTRLHHGQPENLMVDCLPHRQQIAVGTDHDAAPFW